ncbi:MAG TPA: cell division protein FtsX [Thermohalobaculum sp.]|nr:cell division protein FtsX [Thermohalobaculum sp.]
MSGTGQTAPRWRLFGGGAEPPIVPRSGWSAALIVLAALAMSFLAILSLAAGMAADRLAQSWRQDLAGVSTVRITAPADELEARITSALVVLGTSPGVASARLLSDDEHLALLEQWLGPGDWLADLPAPRLIEVRIDGAGPDPARLQAQLDDAVPGALYDGNAAWRGPLIRAAAALKFLAWTATALIALAAAGMVALAARATLAGNAEVVRVIRLIGGEDAFIERAFVGRLTARAVAGGLAGSALGCAALALMPELAPGTPLAVSLGPERAGWVLLMAGVPALSGLIAWATARHSVRLLLRQMY